MKKFFLPPDKENWYKRIENNGWRLVSDRLITHMLNDPVTWSTHSKQINFHHEKVSHLSRSMLLWLLVSLLKDCCWWCCF